MSNSGNPNDAGGAQAIGNGKTFMGHPRGLATLFFTELWERFSYYGMRALLVLYMTQETAKANPGLGLDVGTATAIYGLYTALVYLLSLPGGWVADNIWGQRKAVFVGGSIIAAGHFSMAIPYDFTFFMGLVLIVLGTGLLKPNVSTMVGDLYPEGGARRDAGFSIFYMGINIGAILGPTLCGLLGEGYNWHWGFSLAGFGMLLGLISYKIGAPNLGQAGLLSTDASTEEVNRKTRNFYTTLSVVAAVIIVFAFLVSGGVLPVTLQGVAQVLGYSIVAITLLFFAYLIFFAGHNRDEQKKLATILWLFILSAIFWSGFEQAGSSLNLFAKDLTDRFIFNWQMPASWLQNINPVFIVLLAPVFGWLWTFLANYKLNPSIPVKFSFGLIGIAAGFFVISWGAMQATPENPVTPAWLVVTYFLHTTGELCLSPVGLSSITKLAPRNRVGQMMGIWFVSTSLGNLFAGLVAGQLEDLPPSDLFWYVALISGGAGIVALLAAPPIKKLMGQVN